MDQDWAWVVYIHSGGYANIDSIFMDSAKAEQRRNELKIAFGESCDDIVELVAAKFVK